MLSAPHFRVRSLDRADVHQDSLLADGSTERVEVPRSKQLDLTKELALVTALEDPKNLRGALTVDVFKRGTNQTVLQVARSVFVEHPQPLSCEDGTDTTFPAASADVYHRLVRFGFALAFFRAEHVGFINDNDDRPPQFLWRFDHRIEEDPDPLVTHVMLEFVQIADGGGPELEQTMRNQGCRSRIRRCLTALAHQDVIKFLPQGCELSLGIDQDDLDLPEELLRQDADKPALPASRVGLNQQASFKQLFQVEANPLAGATADRNLHAVIPFLKHVFIDPGFCTPAPL